MKVLKIVKTPVRNDLDIVTLTEAKRHLNVEDSRDDDKITDLIYSAQEEAEDYIGKTIAKSTCTLTIRDFAGNFININEGDFASIVDVKDESDVTLDIKELNTYYTYFSIELVNSVTTDTLTVTYLSGYDAATCPKKIKRAILTKVADGYDTEIGNYE